MKLPTAVVLLLLLPVALSFKDPISKLERMLLGTHFLRELHSASGDAERARAAYGVIGVCAPAAECIVRMEAEYKERRAPEMRRRMKEAGPAQYGLVIDEMCSVMQNVTAECFTQCTPGEDSAYGVFNSANHMICTERRDDVKEAVECAKELDVFSRPFQRQFVTRCGRSKHALDEHADRLHEAYRNGTELKYLADEVLGEDGIAADWCRLSSCYVDELEVVSEEQCGDGKHGKLVRDVLEVLVPKAVAMLDRLYIGCLLPRRCKRAP